MWPIFSSIRLYFTIIFAAAQMALATLPTWSYDPGPDAETAMGRELIDLKAAIPPFHIVSKKLMGRQKFRPAFGPVEWRMLQKPNSVKILFIGQDATHIAEAAGRPATAGFGGRAQDLAKYFGVIQSAGFINTYAFTITGQYGAFESPYIVTDEGGSASVRFGSFVDNQLWLATQDPEGPIAQWRNRLIDWILRNNKDSIRMIVLFGGAARDAAAVFVESKGGSVEPRFSASQMKKIRIPEMSLEYAGGNNEFPVPVNRSGNDLYAELMEREIEYSDIKDQKAAKEALQKNINDTMEKMVFSDGGPDENGLVHPAQLGGFNLAKMRINGRPTLSLKGLVLSDGTRIGHDVLVTQLPHPTALSKLKKEQASEQVAKALKAFEPYVKNGWMIEPDEGATNAFADGDPYVYSRAGIGPEYYDFGAPGVRMVPVSSASRMPKNPHVIIFGTRERVRFDMARINVMTEALPAGEYSDAEMFITRPRSKKLRYSFDPGPGEELARVMKETLPLDEIFESKGGMTFEKNGIAAYSIKSHPEVGDFGHYRGKPGEAKVLVLADPLGYDDLITSRALTGERGQFLHGLLEDIGVADNYFVLKTVPFGMDGANEEEWNKVLQLTQAYRKAVLSNVIAHGKTRLILADGAYAASEVKELASLFGDVPVVAIERGAKKSTGIFEAGKQIAKLKGFDGVKAVRLHPADIPRTHLSFYARLWEGTSGDRVLPSDDKYRGLAFAVVAPRWAWDQKGLRLEKETESAVEALIELLREQGLRLPGESIPAFLRRTEEEITSFFGFPFRFRMVG